MTQPTRQSPRVEALVSMLQQWGDTCVGALEEMIRDIRAGRVYDDTMRSDFANIRALMGRHDVLTNDLRENVGPHRGPGTPGFEALGNRH